MQGGDPGTGAVELADAEAAARADEALDRFLPQQGEAVSRTHRVTALVVSHQGAAWLPRTLAALEAQVRAPEFVVGVDVGSTDGSAALLEEALGTVVELDADEGLAWALRAAALVDALHLPSPGSGDQAGVGSGGTGTDQADPGPGSDGTGTASTGPDSTVRWYWIIHDDSAPQPECLAALLAGADRAPGAHVLVPKTVAWNDPGRLVGIGNRWAPGMPVVERLEPRERDQGQYDTDRPIYSGDSAGMLVRADTWADLAGMEPAMGDWAGPADLCRRVWAIGRQVVFVPSAVVAHRQAGHRGVRPAAPPDPPPRRAARHGQLLLELTQGRRASLPWRWLRGWLTTFVRALALLLTREPEEATAELAGAWDALAHPRRLGHARRAVRCPPVVDLARPEHVRARRGAVLGHSLDAWAAASRRRTRRTMPRIPRAALLPLGIAAGLAAAAMVRDPGALFGSGTLRGGGLLPAPSAGQLVATYLDSWQEVRFGVPSGAPAYLPILAAASLPLLGSVDLLLRLVFVLAVPLAFLSAYASLGAAARPRTSLALAWALLPAGVAAAGAGRISTVALLLLAPPTARWVHAALVRAHAGDRALRPAIAAGTLLGLTSAFAPYAGLLVLVAGLVAWLASGRPRWPVRSGVVIAACTLAFVALWAARVARAPWLLLSDLGRNAPGLVTPDPWLPGLSPGGPSAVSWTGVGLVVLAVGLVVVVAPRGRALAGLAAALALLLLVAWTPSLVALVWPDLPAGAIWPGQPLLLAGGILAVTAAHVVGRQEPTAGGLAGVLADGVGRGVAGVAWLACVAVLAVGWWVAPSVVTVGSGTGLPPVVGLAEQTPERPRALVLSPAVSEAPEGAAQGAGTEGAGSAARASSDDGEVAYAVSTGPQAWLGAAEALAAPEADPVFADVVAGLVSGAGGDLETELGGRGIRYVVFDGSQADPLVAVLDSAIGLRRLASAAEQSLWLVSGQPVRAELVGRQDDPDILVPITTTPTSVDVVLHPQTLLPRTLVLAESADPGWRATSQGRALELDADTRGMLTASVTTPGPLQVEHAGSWTRLATAQLVLMLGLVVLALPKRRTVDADAEEPGS